MRDRLWMWLIVAGVLMGLPASLFAQAGTPDPTVPPGVTIHVVQRGETLFKIATSYGLSVDDLAQLNNISDPSVIYVGQRLLVPAPGATPVPTQSVMHVVQPGESLDSIARLYGMTPDELRARNNLTDANSFYVGLLLDVSSGTAPTPAPTDTPSAPSTPESVIMHTVTRGETMFRIATQYGVSVNDIVEANSLTDPQLIFIGQQLIIPGLTPPKIALDMPAIVTGLDIEPLIFVEGETGRIRLTTNSAVSVTATFIEQTLNDASENGGMQHTLLVGIPVGTTPDVYPLVLTLTDSAGNQTPLPVNIQIVSGGYAREKIQLAPGLEDLLNPKIQVAELTQLKTITSVFTPTRYFDGLMGLPAAAPLSSHFGNMRSYNGGSFSMIHSGTDFAAGTGTPIIAPADGVVVFAGPLDIRGNATIIDHGWGVFTVYCHQSSQSVRVGDMVKAGQIIGFTGSTGRVSGPHLHWELWVDGVVVDAMQWVSQSFS